MGVPGFFAWLLKKLETKKFRQTPIIHDKCPTSVDTLYIDANCLFHPQCHKILAHYNTETDVNKLETKMIHRILEYIQFLIDFTTPTQVFIAVDGPAPLAKLNQQRKRRYKSIQDTNIINQIKKTHGINPTTIWSNTCITPGTLFMEKLHLALVEYTNKLHIKCIYSSYHTPGEGEHKILQELKLRPTTTSPNIIYGLDADLIFLSLASGKNDIYLLREKTELDKKHKPNPDINDVREELNVVSIDSVKSCINTIIGSIMGSATQDDYQFVDDNDRYKTVEPNQVDYTDDFIIVCYFLGNDFLPNIPSIDVKNDGMDLLLKVYSTIRTRTGEQFYTGTTINRKFLHSFITDIAKYEKYYFEIKYPQYRSRFDNQTCRSDNPYEIDIWNFENVKYECEPDLIRLGVGQHDAWKARYYEYYYNVQSKPSQLDLTHDMCKNYIEGIYWITKYYFESCISNIWQYNYYHSPFATDLARHLMSTTFVPPTFKTTITITPMVQLLAVISPLCKSLLPPSYAALMEYPSPIIDLFPVQVTVDSLYKHAQHKCIPFVPNINIERIIEATNTIKLTSEETKRNTLHVQRSHPTGHTVV